MSVKHYLLLAGLLLCLNTAGAEESEWELVREASEPGDVTVHVKPVEDNPIKMFRGMIEVPHPMLSVMAVMGDIGRYPEWVFQCSDAEMRADEWGLDIIRIKINGIWPVSDRDIAARSTIEQDPDTGVITIHSKAAPDVIPEQKGWLRIPALDNRFVLEPLENGGSRITFRTFVDPGGYIPAWLANFVATRAPRDTLTGMAELLREDRYKLDSVDQLPLQFPGIEKMRFPSIEAAKSTESPNHDT